MNTACQGEYQVTLFITRRAQNVEQLEIAKFSQKKCEEKQPQLIQKAQGCKKVLIHGYFLKARKPKHHIFRQMELVIEFAPCELDEIHFCERIGLKEFAQNPSLKTLPEISIREKVEASNFNVWRAVYCHFKISLNTTV